jgi:hypothetical protein
MTETDSYGKGSAWTTALEQIPFASEQVSG